MNMLNENSIIRLDPATLNTIISEGLEANKNGQPYMYKGMPIWICDDNQRYHEQNSGVKYLKYTDRPDFKTKIIKELLNRKSSWSGRVVCTMSANWPIYYFSESQEFGTAHCIVIDRSLPGFIWAADKHSPEMNKQAAERCEYLVADVLNIDNLAEQGRIPGASSWGDLLVGDEIIDLTNIGDHVEEFDDRLDEYLDMIVDIAMNARSDTSLDFLLTSKHGAEKLDEYFRVIKQKVRERNLLLNIDWIDNRSVGLPEMAVPASSEIISQFLVLRFTRKAE